MQKIVKKSIFSLLLASMIFAFAQEIPKPKGVRLLSLDLTWALGSDFGEAFRLTMV